jgi:hypothetical protein
MILNTSDQYINCKPIIESEGNAHVKKTCYQLTMQKQY